MRTSFKVSLLFSCFQSGQERSTPLTLYRPPHSQVFHLIRWREDVFLFRPAVLSCTCSPGSPLKRPCLLTTETPSVTCASPGSVGQQVGKRLLQAQRAMMRERMAVIVFNQICQAGEGHLAVQKNQAVLAKHRISFTDALWTKRTQNYTERQIEGLFF